MNHLTDELRVNSPMNPNEAILKSNSIWGMLRALESFSQIIIPSENDGEVHIYTAEF